MCQCATSVAACLRLNYELSPRMREDDGWDPGLDVHCKYGSTGVGVGNRRDYVRRAAALALPLQLLYHR